MDQPLDRSAFAAFSSRLTAGLVAWLSVFAALWVAAIIQAVVGFDTPESVVLSFATGLLPVLYFALFWTRSGREEKLPARATVTVQGVQREIVVKGEIELS